MPRNGSDIYYIPPGTEGFPDTTIESAKYNTYIHDVETDLNRPRPISAGGTGADDADEALANLGAEKSSQEVTNYDSHIFYPGSFYSTAGATNTPIAGHAFVGFIVSSDPPASPPANLNVVVRAYDQSSTVVPGRIWVREKKAGVWSAWSQDSTGVASATPPVNPPDGLLWFDSVSGHLYIYYRDVDSAAWVIASPYADPAQFLLKAGDTMEGNLALASTPVADMDAANKKYVDDKVGAIPVTDLSNYVAKTGAQTMAGPLAVTGNVSGNAIIASNSANSGTLYLGSSLGSYLSYSPSTFSLVGGNLSVNGGVTASAFTSAAGSMNTFGDVNAQRSNGTGVYYFGGNVTRYIYFDGADTIVSGMRDLILSGGAFGISNFRPIAGVNGGFGCKNGADNSTYGNWFNIVWASPYAYIIIDNANLGPIATISDYRSKKDVAPLPDMWSAVKALRPIKYTHKDFTPPLQTARSKELGEPFVKNDDIERWGFIAHELQDTLVNSAAHGKKDMQDGLQSPNQITVVAALTKALQEAMARIEALEARV